jgi:putative ABC transport system substrate-binding protein
MTRRKFIAIVGGAAALWPVASTAQQAPVIGYLGSTSLSVQAGLNGFRQGLKEAGYVEGQNIAIEFGWAEGDYTRLPALAANLVSRRVAVIVASGPPAARAAKAATSTIPIVFSSGDDPVRIGLVPSFNSPGGNVTGVYLAFSELSAKKLGLLHDLLPQATLVGALLNTTWVCNFKSQMQAAQHRRSTPRSMRSTRKRLARCLWAPIQLMRLEVSKLLLWLSAIPCQPFTNCASSSMPAV